jgi:hypothetical protein
MPLWLKSCKANPTIEFRVITDQPDTLESLPDNVRVIATSITDIRKRLSDAVGFSVGLESGYKLCDFKPAYGLAFSDYFSSFSHWGHVDLDQLFGKIENFIPWETIDEYERLYHRGHMSIYRNSTIGNNLFRLPHPSVSYEQIFKSPKHAAFDETEGIYRIITDNHIPQYERNDAIGDIEHFSARLRLTTEKFNVKHQAFVIENGCAFQIFEKDGKIHRREFMYFHFQKRAFPAVDAQEWRDVDDIIFTPQGFVPGARGEWTIASLDAANKPNYLQLAAEVQRKLKKRWNSLRANRK